MEIGFGFQWRLSLGLLGTKKVSMPKKRSVDTFHTQKSDIANSKIFSITVTLFFMDAMLWGYRYPVHVSELVVLTASW
jgi:hypothetical protein